VRSDPNRLSFEIEARDGAARTGVLHTAHGPVRTPAFIPLATKGTVRGLESREVAELGYEMVLGNTYHLFVSPGPERIAKAGGQHGFMGWERALITDSGGFQVFSLAHGGVANEVKGSGRQGGAQGSVVSIEEEGVHFRSYRDGAELFISPEVSMEVQAALGSDIALVFDECTPFHADREYSARPSARTVGSTVASPGMARTGRSARRSSGSSRAASTRTSAANRRSTSRRQASTASRSAAPSAATRRRCARCWR
jgi:queuine tRNA-ribosyltransferase